MKIRDLPRALGWRSSPREYPYDIETFVLPREGAIRFAQWRHPLERRKAIVQERVDALRRFLSEGDVALDIGAHTGDSTLPIALAAGSRGAVFAFEPNPFVFKILAVNASLNPLKTNIVPLMFAAAPEDGWYEFQYSDQGYCNGGLHPGVPAWRHGHFHRLRVEGRNVSRYLRAEAPAAVARLRYIKIDAEGADRQVVQSIGDLIAAARPYLKVEVYRHLPKEERDAFEADLRRLEYRLFRCEALEAQGEELAPGDFSRWRHFDVLAVPAERV